MIENQAPDIRDVRESEPERTADVVHRGARSGRPDEPSPDGGAGALFARKESDDLRLRWHTIQGHFVDEPRHAVEEADQLVASVIVALRRPLRISGPRWLRNGRRANPLRPKTCEGVC